MYRCQECDYLGEEIVETEEHDEGCPDCGGYCIEFEEMSQEQEKILYDFFEDNLQFFINPNPDEELYHDDSYSSQLLWEDFKEAHKVANTPGTFIYTLVDCGDEEAWIIEGWHIVNRIGYYFTTKEIEIPEDGIRYW